MNIDWTHPDYVRLIFAALVAIVGVGRLSRVLTRDSFPPAAWLRDKWATVTHDGEWALLARCYWCATPWLMAVCFAWGYFTSLHWTWWVFWGWLALSYAASILIARDEPATANEE